jgi:hypothetical protein
MHEFLFLPVSSTCPVLVTVLDFIILLIYDEGREVLNLSTLPEKYF